MTPPPTWIAPMLATAGPVPTGDRWAYEVKFDGVRAIAVTGTDGVRLRSRNDRALTEDYPELAEIQAEPGLLLDGEIVALDESGRSDFELLQQRIHRTRPDRELQHRVPVTLVVFDLLHRGSEELHTAPYDERRAVLRGLGLDVHPRVQVPQHFTGITGEQMLDVVDAHTGARAIFASSTIAARQSWPRRVRRRGGPPVPGRFGSTAPRAVATSAREPIALAPRGSLPARPRRRAGAVAGQHAGREAADDVRRPAAR